MKKILLFSRLGLVHLYGAISKNLENHFEVIHLAYSDYEEEILKSEYNICNCINFKKETTRIYNEESFELTKFQEIDNLIIEYSENRFCLNSAIQSDRTFQFIPYEESLKLCQVYYTFWDFVLIEFNIDYIFHEANALFFTQIASIVARKNGAKYLTQIQAVGANKFNWILVEGDNGFPVEVSLKLNDKDKFIKSKPQLDEFLSNFRSNHDNHLSELFDEIIDKSKMSYSRFIKDNLRLFARHIKRRILISEKVSQKSIEHLDAFSNMNRKSYLEQFRNKWDFFFHLKYDSFDPEKDYYFYPLHFEPEAVVLYWGDGMYKNQVKLIENIAAQLPPNCFLYVKDHPYTGEAREYCDYKRIKAIPNVKLLNPNISGKTVIYNSRGVVTINGTSGFEALLMNKQVYIFGNAIYELCNRVVKVKNIRDFREKVYANYSKTYIDDDELYRFLYAYLDSIHEGFIAYFSNFTELFKIDLDQNSKVVSDGLISYLSLKPNQSA